MGGMASIEASQSQPHDPNGLPKSGVGTTASECNMRKQDMEFYLDKLLFENISEDTSKDTLQEYIEHVLGLKPVKMLYSEEPGRVVVCFPETPDYEHVYTMCQKIQLRGRTIFVSKIPLSRCLLVQNGPSELKLLPKLGANETARQEVNGNLMLLFQTHQDMAAALAEYVKNDWKIECHLECLGSATGSTDPDIFALPSPLTLKRFDQLKLQFLKQSQTAKEELDCWLSGYHARIEILDEGTPQVLCTVNASVANLRATLKTWAARAEHCVEIYFSLLDIKKEAVRSDAWGEIECSVQEVVGKSFGDAVIIMLPGDRGKSFVVVGKKSKIPHLLKEIKAIIRRAKGELEFEKVHHSMNLKKYEFHLLKRVSFDKLIVNRFRDLTVEMNEENLEVFFEGRRSDVVLALKEMRILLQNSQSTVVDNLTDKQKTLLPCPAVSNLIIHKWQAENLFAVFDSDGNSKDIKVYAIGSESDIKKAASILQMSVIHINIPLCPESVELLKGETGTKELRSQIKKHPGKVLLSVETQQETVLAVTATDDIVKSVVCAVQTFLKLNTVFKKTFRFSPSRQKFLSQFHQKDLEHLVTCLNDHKVKIWHQDFRDAIHIEGNENGLSLIQHELETLDQKIVCHKENCFDWSVISFLTSKSSADELDHLEKDLNCVFSLQEERCGIQILAFNQDRAQTKRCQLENVDVIATKSLASGVKVWAVKGDMTEMPVDVIVNAANGHMQHLGGLAGIIVKKGGAGIQEECSRALQMRGSPLKAGEVLMSGPGKLPCKAIVHAVGPVYMDGNNDEKAALHQAILRSLEAANCSHYTSIALPALSTGIFNYPLLEATWIIVGAVNEYFTNIPPANISLHNVYLCDILPNTVCQFGKAMEQCLNPKHMSTMGCQPTQSTESFDVSVSKKGDALKINIVTGEIALQSVDVIVNTANSDLDLSKGAVSNSILQLAGKRLQEELNMLHPEGLEKREIAITGGYELDCKSVFHLVLPEWRHNHGSELLTRAVLKCLEEAHRLHFTSIAFPVLGTGKLLYPAEIVADAMLRAINKFRTATPSSTINQIRIVVYPKDTAIAKVFYSLKSRYQGDKTVIIENIFEKDGDFAVTNFDFKGIRIMVRQGDITEENTDAIVNGTNEDLDLSRGAVSIALATKCGPQLHYACKKKVAQMKSKGVAVTPAFNLHCRNILHVCVCGDSVDQSILKSLKEAEAQKFTSIAVPAFGTGNYKRTVTESAQDLYEGVLQFSKIRQSHFLQEIRVTLYEESMVSPFVAKLCQLHKRSNLSSLIEPPICAPEDFITTLCHLESSAAISNPVALYVYAADIQTIERALHGFIKFAQDAFTSTTICDELLIKLTPEGVRPHLQLPLSIYLFTDLFNTS